MVYMNCLNIILTYLELSRKNQSKDFDTQIASTTICFIQYSILALYKRFQAYETIGGLFQNCKNMITQQIFSDRIKEVIFRND